MQAPFLLIILLYAPSTFQDFSAPLRERELKVMTKILRFIASLGLVITAFNIDIQFY
jgi:hypothetical protein